MGKTFRLDGKSHAVCPEDVVLMEGPGQCTTNDGIVIDLKPKDTLTMTFNKLVPGEAVAISCNALPTTTFFRPNLISGALVDQEAEVSARKMKNSPSPCGAGAK